jgi:hypothetical protein
MEEDGPVVSPYALLNGYSAITSGLRYKLKTVLLLTTGIINQTGINLVSAKMKI